jgi:hypothetical protein
MVSSEDGAPHARASRLRHRVKLGTIVASLNPQPYPSHKLQLRARNPVGSHLLLSSTPFGSHLVGNNVLLILFQKSTSSEPQHDGLANWVYRQAQWHQHYTVSKCLKSLFKT